MLPNRLLELDPIEFSFTLFVAQEGVKAEAKAIETARKKAKPLVISRK